MYSYIYYSYLMYLSWKYIDYGLSAIYYAGCVKSVIVGKKKKPVLNDECWLLVENEDDGSYNVIVEN